MRFLTFAILGSGVALSHFIFSSGHVIAASMLDGIIIGAAAFYGRTLP